VLVLLDDEQQLLAATAARMAATAAIANPADVAVVDGGALWSDLAAAGLLALRAPGDGGAPLGTGLDAALVAEAVGATLAPVPLLGATLAVDLLRRAGAPRALGDEIAGGGRCGLLLRTDLRGLASSAGDHAAGVVWEGEGAARALALGPAAPDGGADVVAVDLDDGWRWQASADLTRRVAHREPGAPVRAEVVGHLDADGLRRWEALALALVSADAVGVMSAALDLAVAYAGQRVQYGVPIGSFQAVQHLCADALVLCEGGRSAVRHAAWAVDELDAPAALRAARVAKAHTSTAAVQVAEISMQVHGGIGQTWEHLCHFHTRRALLDSRLLGGREVQLDRLADELHDAVAP
jgi:alkylation response protein AidB-like acyl-CoA dehydrogenase